MSENLHKVLPTHIKEKEPSSFRLVLTLGIAGLISGIILVSMFNFANPLIEANKKAAMQRAIFKVLTECDSYVPLTFSDGYLVEQIIDEDQQQSVNKEELLIYAGYDVNKKLIGFAIPGSEPGFQDIIATIFGYDASRKLIIGFEVLESKETPGLGDKIFKDADFQTNFTALAVNPEIIPVKNGEKQNNYEVEAITGATISSKAVVRSLNKSIAKWQSAIDVYFEKNRSKAVENE